MVELFTADIIDDTCNLYVRPDTHLDLSALVGLELVPDAAGVNVDGDGVPTRSASTWSCRR